jgi:hypothetical protein
MILWQPLGDNSDQSGPWQETFGMTKGGLADVAIMSLV